MRNKNKKAKIKNTLQVATNSLFALKNATLARRQIPKNAAVNFKIRISEAHIRTFYARV